MCTIGFSRKPNVIFKNRDKNVLTDEEVVKTSDYIAVRTKGYPYFSLGFNKSGCGFVSAAVNSPEWTRLAEQGKCEEAQILFNKDNKGLTSPIVLVSEMLPLVQTIEGWTDALKGAQEDFCGYNIVLVDLYSARIVEVFRQERAARKLDDKSVSTNHFQAIDFGPKSYNDYPNSFDRYRYANETLSTVQTLEDVFAMLKPKDRKRRRCIWREGHFFTISTNVIDLSDKCLYYAQGLDKEYQRINLSNKGA